LGERERTSVDAKPESLDTRIALDERRGHVNAPRDVNPDSEVEDPRPRLVLEQELPERGVAVGEISFAVWQSGDVPDTRERK